MKLKYYCRKCNKTFSLEVPICEINKERAVCVECGGISKLEELMANAKYEEYNGYFNKIRELCIEAYKLSVVADEKWFIDHGIPEAFMKKCKKSHLYGGGKGKQPIYWNWHQNQKYKEATVDNFLDFIRVYGGEQ